MTRCLSERELYAASDARLAPARGAHLAGCAGCKARLDRLMALRLAVRDASAPSQPDWERLETRILRSIRAAQAPRPVVRWSLAPAALALAAAVLVVFAILVGRRPSVEDTNLALAARVEIAAPAAAIARMPLQAAVSEKFGVGAPPRGVCLTEDDWTSAGPEGVARISVGDDIAVDEFGPAELVVASLDEWRPTVRLDSGAFLIAVSEGVVPQELVVLAAHEEFTVYSGMIEVLLVDGALEIRAAGGGSARVELGGEPRELAAGEGLRRDLSGGIALAGSWIPLPIGWEGAASIGTPDVNLDRPSGSLPKPVVREVMRASAEKMRTCYETALKRYPGLEPLPLTAKLRVGVNGRVVRTNLSGLESLPELKRCLVGVLETMRFPPPTGGEVDLIAPLRLTPLD
jgi:hypothetical protein